MRSSTWRSGLGFCRGRRPLPYSRCAMGCSLTQPSLSQSYCQTFHYERMSTWDESLRCGAWNAFCATANTHAPSNSQCQTILQHAFRLDARHLQSLSLSIDGDGQWRYACDVTVGDNWVLPPLQGEDGEECAGCGGKDSGLFSPPDNPRIRYANGERCISLDRCYQPLANAAPLRECMREAPRRA